MSADQSCFNCGGMYTGEGASEPLRTYEAPDGQQIKLCGVCVRTFGGKYGGYVEVLRFCPDDGRCHHGCAEDGACWRVFNAGPLSAAGWGDRWPEDVRLAELAKLGAIEPVTSDPRIEAAAKTLAEDYAYLSQWEVTPAAWYQMARRALEAADHEGVEVGG